MKVDEKLKNLMPKQTLGSVISKLRPSGGAPKRTPPTLGSGAMSETDRLAEQNRKAQEMNRKTEEENMRRNNIGPPVDNTAGDAVDQLPINIYSDLFTDGDETPTDISVENPKKKVTISLGKYCANIYTFEFLHFFTLK